MVPLEIEICLQLEIEFLFSFFPALSFVCTQ